jgi:hypothetical protein
LTAVHSTQITNLAPTHPPKHFFINFYFCKLYQISSTFFYCFQSLFKIKLLAHHFLLFYCTSCILSYILIYSWSSRAELVACLRLKQRTRVQSSLGVINLFKILKHFLNAMFVLWSYVCIFGTHSFMIWEYDHDSIRSLHSFRVLIYVW